MDAPIEAPERLPSYRASDRDRDLALDFLNAGVAEGRLTPEQHGARTDDILRAKTFGDLDNVIKDLTDYRFATSPDVPRRKLRPAVLAIALSGALALGALLFALVLVLSRGTPSVTVVVHNRLEPPPTTAVPRPVANAGAFCTQLDEARATNPGLPSESAVGPPASYQAALSQWQSYTSTDPSFPQDVYTVQSVMNASKTMNALLQSNGRPPSPTCLSAYDSNFMWLPAAQASTAASAISLQVIDANDFVVAARSPSGTCWLEATVNSPSLYKRFALSQGRGPTFFADTNGRPCSVTGASTIALWQPGPLPVQLAT
ncbi:MAG TPA: DUF1707 domain-containing protein [Acidimicrobiales bacterium]|nr:DUF1707 domain-containing protein [Acidimicrobiales bacterium]